MYKTRRTLLASLLVAVIVALGYALAGVPNIELMSITVFVSGFLLGSAYGGIIGGTSAIFYSLGNPLGAALPPVLIAQMAAFAVMGMVGGWSGPALAATAGRSRAVVFAGLLGFLLTLFYDLLTNIGAFFVVTGTKDVSGFLTFVGAGIVFMALHVVWNTAIFATALKPMLVVLSRYRRELSGE